MEKSIRVRILGRDYPLRVQEEDEASTREMAAYVDAQMRAFKTAHPEQSDLVTAVVTALALAEELYTARETTPTSAPALDDELEALNQLLADALSGEQEA